MKNSRQIFLIFTILFSFSCSLNYKNSENSESSIPEFSFKNAAYTKYENSKKSVSLTASQLEQYKSDNAVFAKDASFQTFDDKGQDETKGQCELISADTKKELYTLYGNIELDLPKQEMQISAQSLKFNKKSEQITSGSYDEVTLRKKDVLMEGHSFSASGVSKSFSFADAVEGTITTSDKKEESAALPEEDNQSSDSEGES